MLIKKHVFNNEKILISDILFAETTNFTKTEKDSCFRFFCTNSSLKSENYYFCKNDKNNKRIRNESLQEYLRKVSSPNEMSQFLVEQINWKMQIFTYNDGNITDKSYSILSGSKKICKSCHCPSNSGPRPTKFISKNRSIFIIIGSLALIGNGILIPLEVFTFLRNPNMEKERKIYKLLLINLCCADFLMGVYITVFSSLRSYSNYEFNFDLCNALGVISITSNQVSVTILVLISTYRLYGILFPYKHVRLKIVLILLCFTWVFWIVIACLPTLNYNVFSFSFSRAIKVIKDKPLTIKFPRVFSFFNDLSKHAANLPEDFAYLVKNITYFKSNKVIFNAIKSFDIADLSQNNWEIFGYFVPGTACTIDFLVANRHEYKVYVLSLLLFNLISFLFIFITCFIILKQLEVSTNAFSCIFGKNQQRVNIGERHKSFENQKIMSKLMLIVLTDFVCWVPICTIGLYYFIQSLTTSECSFCLFNNLRRWVAIVVLILIPINSIINPFIYSINIWFDIFKYCKNKVVFSVDVWHSANTHSSVS